MREVARKSPEFLKDSVVYQIFLRPFTKEGTLNAATKLLPKVAELGVDIIYLCPVFEQDDDMREEFWSDRQKASKIGNPKNPYRIKDYYTVDEEYGTDKDLKEFVDTVHDLGMKVLFDLVYLHCGPMAVLIEEHPDFVGHDDDGNIVPGQWHFPLINFESQELREYLWDNMEYFIKEFNVDGYRCDVACEIPIDFWEEGRRRIEALNPNCIMISEGDAPVNQISAFDLDYAVDWEFSIMKAISGTLTVQELRNVWEKMNSEYPEGARFLRIIDNHDIANDSYELRHDARYGTKAVDAALLVNFMLDGIPFIYNGQEVADSAQHSLYDNRFYGKNMTIDWANALTSEGKKRTEYIKSLIKIRHSISALTEGTTKWLENNKSEKIVSLERKSKKQRVIVVDNFTNEDVDVIIDVEFGDLCLKSILENGVSYKVEESKLVVNMAPYGFLVVEC